MWPDILKYDFIFWFHTAGQTMKCAPITLWEHASHM